MDKETLETLSESDRLSVEVSRRQVLATAGKLGLGGAALAAALGSGNVGAALAATRAETLPKGSYHFVFVNHVTTNSFFAPTKVGAQDACTLLGGCSYSWTGSTGSVASEMVLAIQQAANQNASGIAVSLVSNTFRTPVANALAKGIPVVAYNADDTGNKRMAYIGQDLLLSGQAMGKRIVANVPSGSHIVLFIATPGQSNIQPRIDGAIDSIKKSGKNITYDVITTGAAETAEHAAVESYYLGHKTVKGLFAVDGGSTDGVALTSKKHGLAKKGIYVGGFDLSPIKIAAINSGDLNFTIDQQPYLQGFYPVIQLYLYKVSNGLMFPSDTNTGLKFVTKSNIKPYLGSSHFE